jgi:NAD(P)-dependent dehydrogenase (short-subunit alcohol dehydrogenase family)
MRGLQDELAVLGGAPHGNTGRATAMRLAEESMNVVVADLNSVAAEAIAQQNASVGGSAAPCARHHP